MNIKKLEAEFYNYPWHTINKDEDSTGFDYRSSYIYVMKGFRINTNNYTYIKIKIPKEVGHIIWKAVKNYESI